ncbi:hypothetical protein SAMN05216229_12811 [Geopseudomonas sagittaria]|uniref:Uncharacterized protein n=1 Tax=Geopseudomonas sagittaria TaxID=1135990 RepID=A0A1I5Z4C9_9GAMM|nr:hypothetical protein SAMN05216229_12811 [Pseudomonas sagittaria]
MRILADDDVHFICRLLVRQLKLLRCEQVIGIDRGLAG